MNEYDAEMYSCNYMGPCILLRVAHRAANIEQAHARVDPIGSDLPAMLWSPHLAGAGRAISTCLNLTAYDTRPEENKTHGLCVLMQTLQKEKINRKESDVFEETTTNDDVPL